MKINELKITKFSLQKNGNLQDVFQIATSTLKVFVCN